MTGHRSTFGAALSHLSMAGGRRGIGANADPAGIGGPPAPGAACPHCGAKASTPFHEWPAVPDGDALLVNDWHAGLEVPAAPFRLHWCHDCGLVFNAAWEIVRSAYAPFNNRSATRK